MGVKTSQSPLRVTNYAEEKNLKLCRGGMLTRTTEFSILILDKNNKEYLSYSYYTIHSHAFNSQNVFSFKLLNIFVWRKLAKIGSEKEHGTSTGVSEGLVEGGSGIQSTTRTVWPNSVRDGAGAGELGPFVSKLCI